MPSGQQTRLFEVTTKDLDGLPDSRGESVRSMLSADHGIEVQSVRVILGYQVRADISDSESESLVYDLFADPVIETGSASSRSRWSERRRSSSDTPQSDDREGIGS